MKKIILIAILCLSINRLSAQVENQLSTMVTESVNEFVEFLNLEKSSTLYVNVDNLPKDFCCDDLGINPISIKAIKNCSKETKRQLRKDHISVIEVNIILLDGEIHVLVEKLFVTYVKRGTLGVGKGENCRCSIYRYSCEQQEWEKIESLWFSDYKSKRER